ncbi:MAG TPA: endonuclease/exonuclease/phosphatase family protein [Rugosimonospora sp.]|nr:endonuclease/exonuclease/phosphatase family protein [Rugosimonospora sp.]
MKFVTWNCAMALQKKYQGFLTLGADLMVIQECSQAFIEQINRSEGWSSAWFGNNPNKGLAVLVRAPWLIREAQALKLKWAGRLVIDGRESIELFPVWACKGDSPAEEYVGQIHLLLDMIEQTGLSPLAIVAGDFNSNSIWDSDYGIKNHSSAVDRFRKLGLESAYHVFSGDPQGSERYKTHWNMKKKDAAYHVDYAFLSRPLLPRLREVVVGRCDDWLSLSDHSPVLVELDL